MTTLYVWTNKRTGNKHILVHANIHRYNLMKHELTYTETLFECGLDEFRTLADRFSISATLEHDTDIIVNVSNRYELSNIREQIINYNKSINVITKLYTNEGIITYMKKENQ